MKKYVIALVLMLACQAGFAQNVESLYNKFKDEKGVESVSVSPLLMKFARLFMDESEKSNPMIKGISSVRVLDLEDSPKDVVKRFNEEVENLSLNGYETWMQVREDGENVRIMAKMKEDVVRELLVLTTGKGDCALVMVKGKIRKEDIQAVINDDKIMVNGRK